MLYRPSSGKGKDPCVFWHEERLHLFCMHRDDGGDYRNMWAAESPDGVHWSDVGPVIEDAPFLILAMHVHRAGGKFILNHGSVDRRGVQNVLKFWESDDLRHWAYRGEATDLYPSADDPTSTARLDCMNVIASGGRYYGYATGPRGFLRSEDGLHWEFLDTRVDFAGMPAPPTLPDEGLFEVGGCCELGGRFYYLGGWFNYLGRTGYGVHTLVSDRPTGPFTPDVAAYRLCGNSHRWVSLWARPCLTDREVLFASYLQEGFTYEEGDTWTPPLKKGVVDEHGHLRLAWWEGNDVLLGAPASPDLSRWDVRHAGEDGTRADPGLLTRPTVDSITLRSREHPSHHHIPEEASVALLEDRIDVRRGLVIRGVIRTDCGNPRVVSPSAGLVLEEGDGTGTAIWLDGRGSTRIGRLSWSDGFAFVCEDAIDPWCAAPAGMTPGHPHAFRLLVRGCMFEVYLDDRHVQTFNTAHRSGAPGIPPRRFGILARNGSTTVSGQSLNVMTL